MLQETRLHCIRNLLKNFEQVSTERIIQELGVSRETVRRDIVELEAQGLLRRVHGGIVGTDTKPEPPLAVRRTVHAKEKRAIVRCATTLLQSGQTVFMDAGSTTTLLAEELTRLVGLTIVTNSLNAALKLSALDDTSGRPRHEVVLLGGSVDPDTEATFGDTTIAEIYRYNADIAFLSPVGITSRDGAMSFSRHEAAVARAMTLRAKQCVILADNSKVGVPSRIVYAPIDNIDTLITDSGASDLAELTALKTKLRQVLFA